VEWIVLKMRWIMIVSGALTTTMIHAAIAPDAALRSTFGETLSGPLAHVIVRNWGALIALIGAMLIYGAFHTPSRPLVLVVAGLSKVFFVALLVSVGRPYLGGQAAVPVAVDVVMIALFAWYLVAVRTAASGAKSDSSRVAV
jgi:hypothetical protein